MPKNIIVAGSGTGVGKTVTCAILATLLTGDYWKPVQCGSPDTAVVKGLIDAKQHQIFQPAYSLKAPLSPHHAARLENTSIDLKAIHLPQTSRPLIIESVGGIFVPLTSTTLSFDLFKTWPAHWVIISRHYLGSINHTLLTLEALKNHQVNIAGVIFNGLPNQDNESAILKISKLRFLGRLFPEKGFCLKTVQKYATRWQSCRKYLN